MSFISQSEWAQRNGFSRQYASKLVKNGTIPLHDGKIDEKEANEILASIRIPDSDTDGSSVKELSKKLLSARAKKEEEQYKLLKAKNNEYVHVDEVSKRAFNSARTVRDGLLNIPGRVSPILASMTNPTEIENMLNEEIRNVLTELCGEIDAISEAEEI